MKTLTPWRLPALLPILFSIGCAGSAPPPAIEVRTIVVAPPAELMTCAEDPEPPATPASQGDLLVYLTRLFFAGNDCRARLAAIADWSRAATARETGEVPPAP